MSKPLNLSFEIRKAIPTDVPKLTSCICAAYIHYIERIGKQPEPMLLDYSEIIENNSVFVVEKDQAICGALILEITNEGFYLQNVAVHPNSRGKGLGKMLMERAELEAINENFDSIFLATNELMYENREIYLHLGYSVYDHRVVDGYPRVFFRKAL